MTHTEETDPVQQKIDDLADQRAGILYTTKDVTTDGDVYLYPRRADGRRDVYIRFMQTMGQDVRNAEEVMRESHDIRLQRGDFTNRAAVFPKATFNATAVARIAESDARALHDVLVDVLPVTTYAMLRELFITIGGRVPLAATEKKD